jgi:hypothetical protein
MRRDRRSALGDRHSTFGSVRLAALPLVTPG